LRDCDTDGRTDGQAHDGRIYRASIASRGKTECLQAMNLFKIVSQQTLGADQNTLIRYTERDLSKQHTRA